MRVAALGAVGLGLIAGDKNEGIRPAYGSDGDYVRVGYSLTGSTKTQIEGDFGQNPGFVVHNTCNSGGSALEGDADTGIGVVGATNGNMAGVWALGSGSQGAGAALWADSTGIGAGVHATSETGTGVLAQVHSSSGIPLVAMGASGQSASLQEWRNGSNNALSVVTKDGWVGIGTSAPERTLHLVGVGPRILIEGTDNYAPEVNFKRSGDAASRVWALYKNGDTHDLRFYQGGDKVTIQDGTGNVGIGTASPVRQLHIVGSNAVARLDRNVDSASFIFVRTNTDYSQVLKTFTFGVKATGVDAGSFFIGDMHTNVSGSSDNRILIDTSGNVGIGTTTPSSKLHVNGRVKALGYDTGDIAFANGVRATEEGKGLAFLNDAGEKIAVLDSQGNFYVRGRVVEGLPS